MNHSNPVVRLNGAHMEIDPRSGARIVGLSLDGIQLLIPASKHSNYGSTFWDAPQTNWNWPPRQVLDAAPYTVQTLADGFAFTSEIDSCGLQFIKRMQANHQRECFEIEYEMRNCSQQARAVGPWEVTRVEGGLSFFPYEDVPALPPSALQPVIHEEGICWYPFDPAYLAVGHKLFSGAREGWLAHVSPERLLFIKTFPDTQAQDYAPEHGEVEIWGHDAGAYIELENHGAYRLLAPGASSIYRVNWYVRKLPEIIAVKAGNPALLEMVKAVIR